LKDKDEEHKKEIDKLKKDNQPAASDSSKDTSALVAEHDK